MCQAAADIVTQDCPALAEKMYNCSNLFENDDPFSSGYTYLREYCHGIDIMEV